MSQGVFGESSGMNKGDTSRNYQFKSTRPPSSDFLDSLYNFLGETADSNINSTRGGTQYSGQLGKSFVGYPKSRSRSYSWHRPSRRPSRSRSPRRESLTRPQYRKRSRSLNPPREHDESSTKISLTSQQIKALNESRKTHKVFTGAAEAFNRLSSISRFEKQLKLIKEQNSTLKNFAAAKCIEFIATGDNDSLATFLAVSFQSLKDHIILSQMENLHRDANSIRLNQQSQLQILESLAESRRENAVLRRKTSAMRKGNIEMREETSEIKELLKTLIKQT